MAKTFERTILIQCPFSRIIHYIQWVGLVEDGRGSKSTNTGHMRVDVKIP